MAKNIDISIENSQPIEISVEESQPIEISIEESQSIIIQFSTGSSEEQNTITNVSDGDGAEGIYKEKIGSDFKLKTLRGGTNISLTTPTENEILISSTSPTSHTQLSDIGTTTHANIDLHIASTSNPHSVTKTQVGLSNVSNDAQLKIASNLSDLNSSTTARSNLGLGDSATKNVGTITNTVCSGDDSRLSDARTPTSHGNASHSSTFITVSDVTDANITLSDVTTNNASSSKHGFLPKLENTGTKYLKDDGTWAIPSGGSGRGKVLYSSEFTSTLNSYNNISWADSGIKMIEVYVSTQGASIERLRVNSISTSTYNGRGFYGVVSGGGNASGYGYFECYIHGNSTYKDTSKIVLMIDSDSNIIGNAILFDGDSTLRVNHYSYRNSTSSQTQITNIELYTTNASNVFVKVIGYTD